MNTIDTSDFIMKYLVFLLKNYSQQIKLASVFIRAHL